jgi:biopolymer transport protein TolQ
MASEAEVLDATLRSCRRSAAVVHCSMMLKVATLATIASVAPFLGMYGTVLGIIRSFPGLSGEKLTTMARTFADLSDALVPFTLGLLVAIPTLSVSINTRATG